MPTPEKQTPPVTETIDTYYLCPEGDEWEIALAWARKHDPSAITEERILTAINLHQLDRRSQVALIIRKPKLKKGLRHTQPVTESPIDGQRMSQHSEPEEFLDEVAEPRPVRVIDHWDAGENRFMSRLVRSSFIAALGAIATPWAIRFADAASRKGGELPDWITLRSV